MASFISQLKQVFRRLGRASLFAMVILITVAIGVGANTVIFSVVEAAIHGGTNFYVRTVRGLMRVRWAMVVIFIALLGAVYFVYMRLPQSFFPEEDPGYFITVVQIFCPSTLLAARSRSRCRGCRLRMEHYPFSVFVLISAAYSLNGMIRRICRRPSF